MKTLCNMLKIDGYINCRTYINSGNIVVSSNKSKNDVKEDMIRIIKENFMIEVSCYVATEEELKNMIDNAPDFAKTNDKNSYDNIIIS